MVWFCVTFFGTVLELQCFKLKTSYCGILVKVWRPHYQSNRRFYAIKIRRKKQNKEHITFKIPLSVSHRIRTEVPQKRNLWAVEERQRRNTADLVQAKECGNTGGRGVHRPHTYAGEYSAVLKCSTVHGISRGKEQFDDLRQAREFEVQVWVEEFLVQRVVCGYCGAQQKDHSGVYPKST